MKKSFLATALLAAAFSSSALANWSVGIGASNMSMDELDVSFNIVSLDVAKRFDISDTKFNIMPELSIGTGIDDDELIGAEVEIDRFTTISVRGGYQVTDQLNLFITPSYGEIEVTASARGASVSMDSDWEFGWGAGLNYAFTDTSSVEVAYDRYEETDVIGATYRYTF